MPKRASENGASEAKRAKGDEWSTLKYQTGFGNEFATETLPGALPKGQNSPQVVRILPPPLCTRPTARPISRSRHMASTPSSSPGRPLPCRGNPTRGGESIVRPSRLGQPRPTRSWLYRARPGVLHSALKPYAHKGVCADFSKLKADPNQMRWKPMEVPSEPVDFVDGLTTAGAAEGAIAIHWYTCNDSMTESSTGRPPRSFYNSDGDMLIVPQLGALRITTEFGRLHVAPHEICVVQRGIRFSVDVSGPSRGYICEILKGHFEIPSLGPIGANGLANPRDFQTPVAWYDPSSAKDMPPPPAPWTVLNKFAHSFFAATQPHSPYDVVAWHGNYAPFKYNLDDFVCMNSVTVDHPDPSIYTVLTCQSDSPGTAICDFVIFPPRWMVMERSFRPPYYHRNCMTEFMGMVYGAYDAKVGFVPGGSSLHSIGTPHGPDGPTFKAASTAELVPEHFTGGLAFMFETCATLKLSDTALRGPHREWEYTKCWAGLPDLFDPERPEVTKAQVAAESASAIAAAASSTPSPAEVAAAFKAIADEIATSE
jgi:homogentisate 1,2-dioxygenase